MNSDGKSASEIETVQTSASSIMGLEIGPNGNLYYVDNGRDEVIRMDPYMDEDGDGVGDEVDNCPFVANAAQANHDGDAFGDLCDADDDNDAILDTDDDCALGNLSWISSTATDHDMDGCADLTEDNDDDNDGMDDNTDYCATGDLAWTSSSSTDYDMDGCRDAGEDYDDDNDRICDAAVMDGFWTCSDAAWLATDGADAFPTYSTQHADRDGDGYGDSSTGFRADVCPDIEGTSTEDVFGCLNTDGDGWSDAGDAFPEDATQHVDADMDGYGDSRNGNLPDSCPGVFGTSTEQELGCPDSDGDGWGDNLDEFADDVRFWSDIDEDGHPDQQGTNMSDDCPEVAGTSNQDRIGCLDTDGDGWSDEGDVFPNDDARHFTEESSSLAMVLAIAGIAIVGLALVAFGVVSRRGKQNPLNTDFDQKIPAPFTPLIAPVAPTMPTAPTVAVAPPLPPEGLPPGWTMDQWAWYGADYLKNR